MFLNVYFLTFINTFISITVMGHKTLNLAILLRLHHVETESSFIF